MSILENTRATYCYNIGTSSLTLSFIASASCAEFVLCLFGYTLLLLVFSPRPRGEIGHFGLFILLVSTLPALGDGVWSCKKLFFSLGRLVQHGRLSVLCVHWVLEIPSLCYYYCYYYYQSF